MPLEAVYFSSALNSNIFFRPQKPCTIFTDPHISPLGRAGRPCVIQTLYLDSKFDEESIFDVFEMNWEPYDSQNIKTLRGVDLEKSRKA